MQILHADAYLGPAFLVKTFHYILGRWTIAFEQQMSSSHSAVYHRITKGSLITWKRQMSNMRYDCIWLILVWYVYTPMLSWSFRYIANGTRSELNICAMYYVLFQEIYITIFYGVVWYDSKVGSLVPRPRKRVWYLLFGHAQTPHLFVGHRKLQ